MTDIFDVNQYKSENDRLNLTPEQKRLIIKKMYQANSGAMKKTTANQQRRFLFKTVAASLTIALLGGFMWFGFGATNHSKNWFSITVNAATSTEDEAYQKAVDNENSVEGGYSVGAMTGWFMQNDDEVLTKDGYKDYFAYYHMENFQVSGANIKSVHIQSSKKGIYFNLMPNEEEISDAFDDGAENIISNLKDTDPLNNSQYTFEEFQKYAEFMDCPCDGFSYDNYSETIGEKQATLSFDCADIVLESNHSNPEIAALTREIATIKNANEPEGYQKYTALEEKIQQKMLENTQISVTVDYLDGTTETKWIRLIYGGNRYLSFDIVD